MSEDHRLGEVLQGTYQVQTKVGVGGGGEVYLARHLKLEAPVAIKFLKLGSDERMLARFEREARIASSLAHPNIARVYDIDFISTDRPFIVMEWVDGVDLHSLIESLGPLSLTITLDLFEQFCSAMRAAHKKEVVHRDLKPENMLVREEGGRLFLKLVDFGIARHASSTGTLTQGDILGTPAYLAPEVARGQAGDARSDIYAMGLLLFECLAGQSALRGQPLEIYRRQVTNQTVIPKLSERRPELPAELDQVIARACASAAEDRFADVDELHEALKQAAAGELPPGTQRDSIPLAPAEVRGLMRGRTSFELRAAFERRRLRRNVVIAGCAIALVAGGAAWLLGGRMIGPPHGPHDRPPPSPTVHLQIEPAFAELKASDLTHGGAMLPVRGDTIELPRGTSALRLKLEAQGREPVLVDVVPDVDGVLRVSGTQ